MRRIAEAAAGRDPDGLCPDAEALGLYAERGLSGDELGHVEAHVAGCVRCQATVAAFVRSAPDLAAVAGAAGSVDGVQRWWAGWRWLVPATATAAVLMLAVWVGARPIGAGARNRPAWRPIPRSPNRRSCPPTRSRPRRARSAGANVAESQTAPEELQKQLSARSAPVGRDTAAAAPAAVGARLTVERRHRRRRRFRQLRRPRHRHRGGGAEARFERAQPERQREARPPRGRGPSRRRRRAAAGADAGCGCPAPAAGRCGSGGAASSGTSGRPTAPRIDAGTAAGGGHRQSERRGRFRRAGRASG